VCVPLQTKAGDGVINLDQSCRGSRADGQLYRYYGTARVINPNDPGKLEVTFQGQPGKSILHVVDTDYDNYYVSYSCDVVLGIAIENMWLAARKNTMSPETFRGIADRAKKITGFDNSGFFLNNHTGCSYPTKF
jgi:lipocalin